MPYARVSENCDPLSLLLMISLSPSLLHAGKEAAEDQNRRERKRERLDSRISGGISTSHCLSLNIRLSPSLGSLPYAKEAYFPGLRIRKKDRIRGDMS